MKHHRQQRSLTGGCVGEDSMLGPVLVTVAAGFVGFGVVSELLSRGIAVVGLDNFDPYYDARYKQRNVADLARFCRMSCRMSQGSFAFVGTDVAHLTGASLIRMGVRSVVHLAGRAGVVPSLGDAAGYHRANADNTECLLRACADADVSSIAIASSSSVYGNARPPFSESAPLGNALSPYAASKQCMEQCSRRFATQYGLRVAALRFFTAYGPRQRPDMAMCLFARRLVAGEPLLLRGRNTRRDYTYVGDIAAGVHLTLRWLSAQPRQTWRAFNLGAEAPAALGDVAAMLAQALRTELITVDTGAVPFEPRVTWADTSRARAELGFCAQTGLEEGIRRFAAWWHHHQGRFPGPIPRADSMNAGSSYAVPGA